MDKPTSLALGQPGRPLFGPRLHSQAPVSRQVWPFRVQAKPQGLAPRPTTEPDRARFTS